MAISPIIHAVICTIDNLTVLKEQISILSHDPLIDSIIVVNNGSKDGTKEYLGDGWSSTVYGAGTWDYPEERRTEVGYSSQPTVTAINRENKGAGPGRNAGLDAAGEFDFALMIDGGIRPLRGGTQRMLEYLERVPEADVLGIQIEDFEVDRTRAWRRWTEPITDEDTYPHRFLSLTAYCLARYKAFDGLRFCEEGPFGEPGWGVDDNEMMSRWNEAGIVVHAVKDVHPFRRGSGSFRRLFEETGVWPNQHGSVFEQRCVKWSQDWPQWQWGEPWLTLVVKVDEDDVDNTARLIKGIHSEMRTKRFGPPFEHVAQPYSIIASCERGPSAFLDWAEPRCLRQHHGAAIMLDGKLVRKTKGNGDNWTGDFRICHDDWHDTIRPNAHYYALVNNETEFATVLEKYDQENVAALASEKPHVMRMRLYGNDN